MADEMKKEEKPAAPKSVKVGDVLAKDKAAKPKVMGKPKAAAAPKKPKHKHTHIESHSNGSYTTRHTPEGGGEETSYSSPDLQGVIKGLQEHLGGGQAQPAADPNAAPDAAPAQDASAAPAAAGAPPMAQPQPGM